MNQITRTFELLKQNGRKALMPYVTMGYPQLESALDLVPAIEEAYKNSCPIVLLIGRPPIPPGDET